MRRERKGFAYLPFLVLLIVILIIWWSRTTILGWAGTRLEADHAPRKADAIVILAGGLRGERILKGGELLSAGYAPFALFSGPTLTYETNECDWAFPYAERHGYPRSMFMCVPNASHSTVEEAGYLLAELRRRNVHSMLLVTSDYHTRRAEKIYKKLAPEMDITTVAARSPEFQLNRWWEYREGRKLWLLETVKSFTEPLGL